MSDFVVTMRELLAAGEIELARLVSERNAMFETESSFDELSGRIQCTKRSIFELKVKIAKNKRAAFAASLMSRQLLVRDERSQCWGPTRVVMHTMTKEEWFASLDAQTRYDVTKYGRLVTKGALMRELQASAVDDGHGRRGINRNALQHSVDLSANLVDDGEEWYVG